MSRLTPLEIGELSAEQREVYDAMQSGPRGVGRRLGLVGPFGVWVRSPKIGHAAQAFGAVARFETSLPERRKEIAICAVGAHYKAKFEFAAHGAMAVAAGVPEAVVDAIRRGEPPRFDDATDALTYHLTTELLRDHRIRDETYAEARDTFGESALIELVSIIGYYCLVSLTLNAFEVPLTATMHDPFPD